MAAPVYAVIMAGGAGTRFWPASRSLRPKQLLPLAGAAGRENEPLLAATLRRLEPIVPAERVIVVTGEHLAEATSKAVPRVPAAQILKEPAPRNTAPCIAWANAVIAKLDPEAVVMVLPSDQVILDEPGFVNVLKEAVASAERGDVTTIGIVPTRAETGYGYIEVGDPTAGTARRVKRFVEKPNREKAEGFLKEGPTKFLWNAGMFFFRVKDMAALLEKHLPSVAAGVAQMTESRVKEIFPTLQSISIDNGVMEKAENLAVVPGSFGWNDVGSWQSAWELEKHDAAGNGGSEGFVAIDAKNNLAVSMSTKQKKTIALVGVNDLVVVETDDAVLVIPRDRAQDVRLIVEELKKRNRPELL